MIACLQILDDEIGADRQISKNQLKFDERLEMTSFITKRMCSKSLRANLEFL